MRRGHATLRGREVSHAGGGHAPPEGPPEAQLGPDSLLAVADARPGPVPWVDDNHLFEGFVRSVQPRPRRGEPLALRRKALELERRAPPVPRLALGGGKLCPELGGVDFCCLG